MQYATIINGLAYIITYQARNGGEVHFGDKYEDAHNIATSLCIDIDKNPNTDDCASSSPPTPSPTLPPTPTPFNQPPVVIEKTVKGFKNTPLDITIYGEDPDNDPVQYQIIDRP